MLQMLYVDELEFLMDTRTADAEFAAVNTWLRATLSHRLSITVLAPPGGDDGCADLCMRLASYPEVLVRTQTPLSGANVDDIAALLADTLRFDDDVTLIWARGDTLAQTECAQSVSQRWVRDVFAAAERTGLLDRCFTALIGPEVSRERARKLGYEDGFPADMPLSTLVRQLGQEALNREQYRRRGSSPPCYL